MQKQRTDGSRERKNTKERQDEGVRRKQEKDGGGGGGEWGGREEGRGRVGNVED